jgi:tRNA1Val (adenine37-N6)-methyltransferase
VGTGTGLIALMMAQRSNAAITGIEIEKNASEEAVKNVLSSPCSERIAIINTSFQDFAKQKAQLFDLIISNPPFFSNSQKSKCELQAIARHNHMLPPADFITCSLELLAPLGNLAVILPIESAGILIRLAEKHKLHLLRETEVRPKAMKKPHRYLLEFSKTKRIQEKKETVIIHNDDGIDFNETYKNLTKDFYLNF